MCDRVLCWCNLVNRCTKRDLSQCVPLRGWGLCVAEGQGLLCVRLGELRSSVTRWFGVDKRSTGWCPAGVRVSTGQ